MEVVRSLGPDRIIDYTQEDFTRQEERFDLFFDVAATRPLRDCLGMLVPKGTFVGAGAPKGGLPQLIGRLLASLATSPFTSRRIVWLMAKARHAAFRVSPSSCGSPADQDRDRDRSSFPE